MKNTMKIPMAAVCATLLLLCGCASAPTHEELVAREQVARQYDKNKSFAYNMCSKYIWSGGVCPEDVYLSDEKYKELYGDQSKAKDLKHASSGDSPLLSSGINAGVQAALDPRFFDSFSGWGPSMLFVVSALLIPPKENKAFVSAVAFIPADKAANVDEAAELYLKAMIKAEEKFLRRHGITDTKIETTPLELRGVEKGTAVRKRYLFNHPELCPKLDPSLKDKYYCTFNDIVVKGGINSIPTVIPDWLPNAGKKVWRVSAISAGVYGSIVFKKTDGAKDTGPMTRTEVAMELIKDLPDDFYMYVPQIESPDKAKRFPPVMLSKNGMYFFVKPKNID